jgi:hypothetical protein
VPRLGSAKPTNEVADTTSTFNITSKALYAKFQDFFISEGSPTQEEMPNSLSAMAAYPTREEAGVHLDFRFTVNRSCYDEQYGDSN